MTKLFQDVQQRRVIPVADQTPRSIPGALAQGATWALFKRSGSFFVDYMSGTVGGIGGSLRVSDDEAEELRSGDEAVATRIINAHGGS